MTNAFVRCIPCVIGMHAECIDSEPTEDGLIACCCGGTNIASFEAHQGGEVGRPMKEPSEIDDIRSTGRKRAAKIAPIFDGMVCEWAGLKFAGGGVVPIVGCSGNTIATAKSTVEARSKGADSVGRLHHGCDKNTLNNTPGINLHRVCEECHQRWHAMNNSYYEDTRPDAGQQWFPGVPYFLHDASTQATEQEISDSAEWWAGSTKTRGPYPFELPALALQRKPQRLDPVDDSDWEEDAS